MLGVAPFEDQLHGDDSTAVREDPNFGPDASALCAAMLPDVADNSVARRVTLQPNAFWMRFSWTSPVLPLDGPLLIFFFYYSFNIFGGPLLRVRLFEPLLFF